MPSLSEMAKEAKKKSKAPPPKNSAPRTGLSSVFKSAERVADSDLGSDTESDSDSDSDPEPPKVAMKTSAPVVARGDKNAPPMTQISESDDTSSDGESSSGSSSSDEEDSDDSEDDEEALPKKVTLKAASPEKQVNPAPTVSVRVEPIAPYIPPSGFEAVAPSRDAAMSSSQFFSNQNLAGKQVWYITAPASVPISAIKKVSLQDVSLGKPSVFLNGQDYGFVENKTEDRGHAKIMIPDKSSSTYRLAKRPIDQALHLQQIVRLPSILGGSTSKSASSQTPSRATIPAKKPVRQQPDGLKMRFHPIGSTSTKPIGSGFGKSFGIISSRNSSDSDSEMEDAPPTFKQPLKLAQTYADDDSTSSEDESSSEEEVLKDANNSAAKTVVPADAESTTSSDESSEEDAPAKPFASEKDPDLQKSSLKRKLSDMHDSNPHSSLSQSPNLNSTQLKKVKLNPTISQVPHPVRSMSNKINGHPKGALQSPNSSQTLRDTRSSPILPQKLPIVRSAELPASGSMRQSQVPPPRSIILPPRVGTQSSAAGSSLRRSGSASSQSIILAKSPESPLNLKMGGLSKDVGQQPDPILSDKQRRTEKKKLKGSRADNGEDRETATPSINGDQTQPASTWKAKKMKTSKEKATPNRNEQSALQHSSMTPIPPPKKMSSILPSKKVSAILPPI